MEKKKKRTSIQEAFIVEKKGRGKGVRRGFGYDPRHTLITAIRRR